MAYFSLIYDGLISTIAGQLSSYTRLPDAYNVSGNDLLRIVKGYSLAIADGENTNRYICDGVLSHSRRFTLTLTNLITANDLDATGRATVEKSLFEDTYGVWKKLQTTTHLGSIQVSNVAYINDNGIEYFLEDNNKAISIVSTISLEYFE